MDYKFLRIKKERRESFDIAKLSISLIFQKKMIYFANINLADNYINSVIKLLTWFSYTQN